MSNNLDSLINTYTHFAIGKADGLIYDGWEYDKDTDSASIKEYCKNDLKDNFPDNKLSDFTIVTRNTLKKYHIDNPSDTKYWYKVGVNEEENDSESGKIAKVIERLKETGQPITSSNIVLGSLFLPDGTITDEDKIDKYLEDNRINEAYMIYESEEGDDEKDKKTSLLYSRVQQAMDNKYIRHAPIIQDLWGTKDATNRSLFAKKLYQEKNEEGVPYSFTKEELASILSIVGSICSGKGKGKRGGKGKFEPK